MNRLGNVLRAARRWISLKNPYKVQAMYKSVFDTPEGQVVLAHICKHNFVFRTTYVQGADPTKVAFNEGKRHTALSILRFVNKSPEQFLKMIEDGMEQDAAARIQTTTRSES
jgi:hypothetical protein